MSFVLEIFNGVLWVFFLGMSFWLLYLAALLAVAILHRSKKADAETVPVKRFAIIVPAHNEVGVIERTLSSLASIDYPVELFSVLVVADNCTDQTAEIARAAGVRCLERHDSQRRGKGYALEYAFVVLLRENFDALIVVDADTIVSKNVLNSLNSRFQHGEKVIQIYNGIANPTASPLTYFFSVGNTMENDLFYIPKEHLKVSSILRGNGMCFSREVLEKVPWNAHSIVEDTEYSIELIRRGFSIHFASEARVLAYQPENLEQAHIQRVRWASGNAALTKTKAISLVREGIVSRNLNLVDCGITLLVQSKPLMIFLLFGLLALTLIMEAFDSGESFLLWTLVLFAVATVYFAMGIFWNGLKSLRPGYLLSSPFYLVWMVCVICLGMLGFRKNAWLRTKRV